MHQPEHRQASCARKAAILDALELTTALDRKTIIRHLNGPYTRQPRTLQRGRT